MTEHKHFYRYKGRVWQRETWWTTMKFQCQECGDLRYVYKSWFWRKVRV